MDDVPPQHGLHNLFIAILLCNAEIFGRVEENRLTQHRATPKHASNPSKARTPGGQQSRRYMEER